MAPKKAVASMPAGSEVDAKRRRTTKGPEVKQEKESKALCVLGKSGEDLSNAVQYRLQKPTTPQWVRDYYDGKVKYNKGASKEQKAEFLRNLLAREDFEGTFFQRLITDKHEDTETTTMEWLSWKGVLAKEDEEVAKVMVKSGRLVTRLREGLDHDDPEVQALPNEQKLHYKYISELEATGTKHTVDDVTGDVPIPEENGEEEQSAAATQEQRIIGPRSKMHTARALWSRVEPDLDMRVASFAKNEYVAKPADDAQKMLAKIRKSVKVLIQNTQAAMDTSQECDDDTIQGWEGQAEDVQASIKSLKTKLQCIGSFLKKTCGGATISKD